MALVHNRLLQNDDDDPATAATTFVFAPQTNDHHISPWMTSPRQGLHHEANERKGVGRFQMFVASSRTTRECVFSVCARRVFILSGAARIAFDNFYEAQPTHSNTRIHTAVVDEQQQQTKTM